MSLIGAAVLALVMQPVGETPIATETGLPAREYDEQLNTALNLMIATAEIGPDGQIFLHSPIGDQRFFEQNSGRYWQISGEGQEDFRSRSLWNRTLKTSGSYAWTEPLYYNSDQFSDEPLRVAERTTRLPGSDIIWRFVVARSRDEFD